MRGIHRSPVISPRKGQWRGALIFSLTCAWIKAWISNHGAGDLRRYRAHHDVIVIYRGDTSQCISTHDTLMLYYVHFVLAPRGLMTIVLSCRPLDTVQPICQPMLQTLLFNLEDNALKHLHSLLNTWLNWIGQRPLQNDKHLSVGIRCTLY